MDGSRSGRDNLEPKLDATGCRSAADQQSESFWCNAQLLYLQRLRQAGNFKTDPVGIERQQWIEADLIDLHLHSGTCPNFLNNALLQHFLREEQVFDRNLLFVVCADITRFSPLRWLDSSKLTAFKFYSTPKTLSNPKAGRENVLTP
jgi:hypothetical protein